MTEREILFQEALALFGAGSEMVRAISSYGQLNTQDDVEVVFRHVYQWEMAERGQLNRKIEKARKWLEDLKQYYIDMKKREQERSRRDQQLDGYYGG
jgi:lysyl-tRNA synthetase class I